MKVCHPLLLISLFLASPALAQTAPSAQPGPATATEPGTTPAAPAVPQPETVKGEMVNRSQGLAITPPSAWTDSAANSTDPTLAFRLQPANGSEALMVFVGQETARSLRGLWTGLRYSVIVEMGGSILKDEIIKVSGAGGRIMIYETYPKEGVMGHLEVDVISQKRFMAFYFDAPKAVFDARLPALRSAILSARLLPISHSEPKPPDEENKKP